MRFLPLTKRGKYTLGSILDIACLILVVINAAQPAAQLITPLMNSWQNAHTPHKFTPTEETFRFVPGWATNKYTRVVFNEKTNLSFFDVPVDNQGNLHTSSRGYTSFHTPAAQELLTRAQGEGAKTFLTLSQSNKDVITSILYNPSAQQTMIDQAVEEVKSTGLNGITLDFELRGATHLQTPLSDFVGRFSEQLHQKANASLAVAIPDFATNQATMYNVKDLGQKADRVFLIAYEFTVPETRNGDFLDPRYGYKADDYWATVGGAVESFTQQMPAQKLALEAAWYGNGDNYPLYTPDGKPKASAPLKSTPVVMDQQTLNRLVEGVPTKARDAARRNIPIIAKALEQEGILDSNVLAYALATIEHETDSTFEPIEEIQGRMSARRLGYEGGTNYFGRGFIQLTHLRNYRMIGERIGMGDTLAAHPEMASQPETAAKILAAFFKDNNVANLATRGDFIAARQPVNPDRNGRHIASLAYKYE